MIPLCSTSAGARAPSSDDGVTAIDELIENSLVAESPLFTEVAYWQGNKGKS